METALFSMEWIFTAIVMALIMTIVAYYSVRFLDRRLSRVSTWWRRRSAARITARSEYADYLRQNSTAREAAVANEIRNRFKSLTFLVLAVLVFLLLQSVKAVPGLWMWPLAVHYETVFVLADILAVISEILLTALGLASLWTASTEAEALLQAASPQKVRNRD